MLSAAQGFVYNKFEKPNDWPKLKDTFDYQIENGKLLGGNEHLYLSGPNTYTATGSPTIVDNVASGFSASDYLSISSFPISSADWEIKSKVTSSVYSGGTVQNIFTRGSNFQIRLSGSGLTLQVVLRQGLDTPVVLSGASINSRPYFRVVKSSDGIYIYQSADDVTYTAYGPIALTGLPSDGNLHIGDHNNFVNGTVNLNNTYIKVNGNLWFYGKNYTTKNMVPVPVGLEYNNTTTPEIGWVYTSNELVKGPVNYTKVGNPKIVDGVASGFTYDNYLKVLQPTSGIAEFVFKFKYVSTGSGQCLYRIIRRGSTEQLIRIDDSNKITFANNIKDLKSTTTLLDNTNYWLKIIYNPGNSISLLLSTNGTDYTLEDEASGDVAALADTEMTIGGYRLDTYMYKNFAGSIDLNHTYIKVNGQPWFGSVSKFQEFIPVLKGTMIGKDDTHTLNVVSKNNIGTVGYTVVGTPTIVDGVLTSCDADNYLNISNSFDTSKDFEIFIKAKPANSQTTGNMLGFGNGHYCYLRFYDTRLSFRTYTGSGNTVTLDSTYSASTWYYIRAKMYNGTLTLGISTDKTNWTEASTTPTDFDSSYSYIRIGAATYQSTSYYNGQIDFNETYIKVNNQMWFGTLPAEPKLVGPIGYTVVGSPTISNGVVSGFSENNYLETTSNASSTDISNYEFGIGINVPELGTLKYILGYRTNSKREGFNLTANGELRFLFGRIIGTLTDFGIISSLSISQGDTVISVAGYRGNNTWFLRASKDNGATWVEDTVTRAPNTLETVEIRPFTFGKSDVASYNAPFEGGSIDLNNTYIKVNGALWFGKENWNPAIYDNNSIVELVGHKSDYSQYNELGFTPIIETDSDEVGTYNVWIDNQKIRSNMSQGTHIDWSKLALSTGYSITTPSSLKAHTIKIEPTNELEIINSYQSDANYEVQDGKLVWVDPNIYLQSTGSQCINSGFQPDNKTRIICKVSFNSTTSYHIFGARTYQTAGDGYGFGNVNGLISDFGGDRVSCGSLQLNKIYEIDKNGPTNIVKVDGISTTYSNTDSTFLVDYNLYLFCINTSDTNFGPKAEIKLYNLKIYNNGIMVRDFVPVPAGMIIGNTTIPNNGMFDMISQQFYNNDGTGIFTIGKDS